MRRLFLQTLSRLTCIAAVGLVAPQVALAQSTTGADKPPLRILVGFPPGGSADTLARLIGDALRDDFSPVTVENRAGAAGRIALNAVKSARPDGQTILVTPSGPMVLFPHVYKKLDYDPVKDFTPVSLIGHFQFGVVAGPSSKARTVAEMVAQAKAEPGKGSYGTPGAGTLPHFMGVLMEQTTGISLNHVPFQGGGPANNALLGGHIDYKFDVVSETAELHRAGRVRVLGVTGRERDPQLPDVPTLRESGVDLVATAWFAVYAPPALPAPVLQRLERAVAGAVARPEFRARLVQLGIAPVGSTSAELATSQARDLARWERPIKATGVQLD